VSQDDQRERLVRAFEMLALEQQRTRELVEILVQQTTQLARPRPSVVGEIFKNVEADDLKDIARIVVDSLTDVPRRGRRRGGG